VSGWIARVDDFLGKSKRNRRRDSTRYLIWKCKRYERRRLLHDSYWDPDLAELVAIDNFYLHDIHPGEVVFDQRGFVTPSLGVF